MGLITESILSKLSSSKSLSSKNLKTQKYCLLPVFCWKKSRVTSMIPEETKQMVHVPIEYHQGQIKGIIFHTFKLVLDHFIEFLSDLIYQIITFELYSKKISYQLN